MRTELQPGTIITLLSDGAPFEFRIDCVIGDGASCIVYEATMMSGANTGLRYRIKECYPHNAAISRRGTTLLWEDEAEREQAYRGIRLTHSLLLQLRNDEQLGDSIVHSFLCEGDGTLYVVMSLTHARTYEQETELSIHSALETARVLATHIGQLHAKGLLHLDIKPANFLVKHRPSTAIWLFDVDSFTAMSDIAAGQVASYPYSKGYAAPEQLCGKNKKLSPATDIYAIGSILFEKIMGRPVSNEDMGFFPDWEFSGELFENVNPKVHRFLREIFQHTLAASPSRRYQSVDDLLVTIDKALSVTIDGKPYLQSSERSNTIHFVGREEEIAGIRVAFSQGKRAVFLHGNGGIGKSSVAIAYSEQYRSMYEAVIFLRYRDSLQHLLTDVHICNYEDDNDPEKKLRMLRKLLDKNVLLIIDNFDVEIDQDEFLPELLTYPAHLLITSRTNFSSVYEGSIAQIEVERLPDEHLVELFSSASQMTTLQFAEKESFAKLCKHVEYNTYMVDLLGRQCVASCISVDVLWERMKNGLTQLKAMEKVWSRKDDRPAKRTISDALRVLFRVADLSEDRQRALRNLYMLRFLSVDWEAYCVFSYVSNIEVVNDLVELGWVQKHGVFFSLHPLIEELVQHDLQPAKENCSVFYALQSRIADTIELYSTYGEAEEIEREFNTKLLYSFAMHSDLSNHDILELILYWLRGAMLSNEGLPRSSYYSVDCEDLYWKLERLADSKTLTPDEIVSIRCIGFIYCLSDVRWVHDANGQVTAKCFSPISPAYCALMHSLDEVSHEHACQTIADIATSLSNHLFDDVPNQIIKSLYDYSPDSFSKYEEVRWKYGLPLSDEEYSRWEKHSNDPEHVRDDKGDAFDRRLKLCAQYSEVFLKSSDKAEIIRQVFANAELSYYDRFEIVSDFFDRPFTALHMKMVDVDYSWVNWLELSELLEVEEDCLLEVELSDLDHSELQEWDSCINNNLVNQTLTYAALQSTALFDMCIADILEHDVVNAKRMLNHNTSWQQLAEVKIQVFQEWPQAINSLLALKRASYAAPVVKRIIEGWLEYVRNLPDYTPDSERGLIGLFQLFIECLEAAENEANIPVQYILPYSNLICEYQSRIEKLTDTRFIVKPPEDTN